MSNLAKRKPRIGITPYSRETNRYVQYIHEGYTSGVERAGGEWVMVPHHTQPTALIALAKSLDGVLFSGGPDVNPRRYGAAREADCGEPVEMRDETELRLMELAVARDVPILGICRGLQLVNVALGGTLTQHVPNHTQPREETFWHEVRVEPGTLLAEFAGANSMLTNSHHHQCALAPAPGAVITAYAPDGVPEALEAPSFNFLMAVQWHPERTLDADAVSMRFFEELARRC